MRTEKKEVDLLRYDEVLDAIRNQENHLLLGNGFNLSLGVDTKYRTIFQKMTEESHGVYKDAQKLVKECDYDLEKFIGKLTHDVPIENQFLRKFINNKIKLDFMQATHKIVKSAIKHVYAENNEGIFLLLKHFSSYFTLNYDPFLYLLLLNFKIDKNEEDIGIGFPSSLLTIKKQMDEVVSNIFSEVTEARKNGRLTINIGDGEDSVVLSLKNLTKTEFSTAIRQYAKAHGKGWKRKDIEKTVDIVWDREKKTKVLEKVSDGFRQPQLNFGEPIFDNACITQNLFFLHGAFHIYRDGNLERKITQQSDKALYERIGNVLNSDQCEIVCVFQAENKKSVIDESNYLSKCYNKLRRLSGKMVIIGCSLDDNDNHIFQQINDSDVDTLYISTLAGSKESIYTKAKNKFPSKSVFLFDAETISYKLPDPGES